MEGDHLGCACWEAAPEGIANPVSVLGFTTATCNSMTGRVGGRSWRSRSFHISGLSLPRLHADPVLLLLADASPAMCSWQLERL